MICTKCKLETPASDLVTFGGETWCKVCAKECYNATTVPPPEGCLVGQFASGEGNAEPVMHNQNWKSESPPLPLLCPDFMYVTARPEGLVGLVNPAKLPDDLKGILRPYKEPQAEPSSVHDVMVYPLPEGVTMVKPKEGFMGYLDEKGNLCTEVLHDNLPPAPTTYGGGQVVGLTNFPDRQWKDVKDIQADILSERLNQPEYQVPPEACLACDGEGHLSTQWAKSEMEASGGRRLPLGERRKGFYYVTGEGKEIPFKTIGGLCSVCRGTGLRPEVRSLRQRLAKIPPEEFAKLEEFIEAKAVKPPQFVSVRVMSRVKLEDNKDDPYATYALPAQLFCRHDFQDAETRVVGLQCQKCAMTYRTARVWNNIKACDPKLAARKMVAAIKIFAEDYFADVETRSDLAVVLADYNKAVEALLEG